MTTMISRTVKPVIVRTGNSVTVFIHGEVQVIGADHPNYKLVLQAIEREDWASLPNLLTPAKAMEQFVTKSKEVQGIEVRGGIIYLDGRPFSDRVSQKALALMEQGVDPTPIHRFLKKVRENPSRVAQEELLLFCAANDFMIDSDGDIIAFKAVRRNYRDCHTGTFDNSVGQRHTMERNEVDDRRDVTCSHGFHFAARRYAQGFGSSDRRIMVVKVNPRDVVSIPSDYQNEKARCCDYLVIAEIPAHKDLPKQEVYQRSDFRGLAGPDEDVQPSLADQEVEGAGLDNISPEQQAADLAEIQEQAHEDAVSGVETPAEGKDTGEGEIASEEASQAPQDGPAQQVDGVSDGYDGMSRDALRALAKERGVQCPGKVKQDYVDALRKADQS